MSRHIRPTAFQISSQGGDAGNQHEISFNLSYYGTNTQTLSFPTDVAAQCTLGGNSAPMDRNCDFESGQTNELKNVSPLIISDYDAFSSLHWNVKEHDSFGDDFYTISMSADEWKLSPKQCVPYEIKIALNTTPEVKHSSCFSLNLGITAGVNAGLSASASENVSASAQASLGAEFGMGWERCSEWITPPQSYILFANVFMDSAYPDISAILPVCTTSRIALKDGYNHSIFPYQAGKIYLPNWISYDNQSYIAKPLANHVGDHKFSLSVYGPCGEKNLTTYLKIAPEIEYPSMSYTIDACTAAKLLIKDANGNLALPSSPGTSLNWITYDSQAYKAIPLLEQIGSHDTTLSIASPCGIKNVKASILVQPEKAYSDIAYSVEACSAVRLIVKNAYGDSVPPSASPTSSVNWLSFDSLSYIAKPLSPEIGAHSFKLSMFSYCGARDVNAALTVTESKDFLVDKKIIKLSNTEAVSYHQLNIIPSTKSVKCENFSGANGTKYDWFSINEDGYMSLTPTQVEVNTYSVTGICADECGHSQESHIEIHITNEAESILYTAGLALLTIAYATMF